MQKIYKKIYIKNNFIFNNFIFKFCIKKYIKNKIIKKIILFFYEYIHNNTFFINLPILIYIYLITNKILT